MTQMNRLHGSRRTSGGMAPSPHGWLILAFTPTRQNQPIWSDDEELSCQTPDPVSSDGADTGQTPQSWTMVAGFFQMLRACARISHTA